MTDAPLGSDGDTVFGRGPHAVFRRTGAAVDCNVEHACRRIGTEIRVGHKQILQQPPGGGAVDGRAAHQGTERGLGAVGDAGDAVRSHTSL